MRTFRVLLLMMTGVALAASFQWLRPPPAMPSAATPANAPLRAEYRVSAGRRAAGPERIEVMQGRRLEIIVQSDQADELHLHGYELERELAAGMPVTLALTADRSGHFELELHHAGLTLGVLDVEPR